MKKEIQLWLEEHKSKLTELKPKLIEHWGNEFLKYDEDHSMFGKEKNPTNEQLAFLGHLMDKMDSMHEANFHKYAKAIAVNFKGQDVWLSPFDMELPKMEEPYAWSISYHGKGIKNMIIRYEGLENVGTDFELA
jgi:hypothetical protein